MTRDEAVPFEQLLAQDMLYAFAIRAFSNIGNIQNINVPPLPEGYTLITADRLPFKNELRIEGMSLPLLAAKKVSYIGEVVGLIVGPDPLLTEELALNTIVDCEAQESRLDWQVFSSSDISARIDYSRGKEKSSSESLKASEAEDSLELASYLRLEPHEFSFHSGLGALAEWENGRLKLSCPALAPELIHSCLAELTGLSTEDIEILQSKMYDNSGIYFWYPSLLAARSAAAARVLGRPIKLLISIQREKRFLPGIHGISLHMKTRWSTQKHCLMDVACRFAIPVGAYSVLDELILEKTVRLVADAMPNIPLTIIGFTVKTNMIPMGALDCISSSAIFSMLETHIARAARKMDVELLDLLWMTLSGIDSSSIMNKMPPKEESSTEKILRPLLEHTDFHRKYAAYEQIHKRSHGAKETRIRAISLSIAEQSHIDSSCISTMADLAKIRNNWISYKRYGEGLPIKIQIFSSMKQSDVSDSQSKSIRHLSQGAAILEVDYDSIRSIFHSLRLDISIYVGKILCPSAAKGAIRSASIEALLACLSRSIYQDRNIDDIYKWIFSEGRINIELMKDEKANFERSIGDLAYTLVLSCFLEVMQQLNSSERLILPLKPTPTAMYSSDLLEKDDEH